MRSVTCAMCGSEVDDADCVEMPNGLICEDPCYKWLERMIDEANEDGDDEGVIFVFDPDEEDYDEEDDDGPFS